MSTALADNFVVLQHANLLRIAVLQLSKLGYLVRRISGGSRLPSIEIDRPLLGFEPAVTTRENKIFFSVDYQQCRVYWVIEKPVNQDEGLT